MPYKEIKIMQRTSQVATFFLLSILFCNATSENYYIKTSSNDSCPEDPCLTLSKFATSISNYLHFNTTLILLPGNHSLDSILTVANINIFLFHSYYSRNQLSTNFKVVCTDSAARFEFTSIVHVQISGLKFLGCVENRVESVRDFKLENTYFEGQGDQDGTALELVNSTIEIKRSSFVFNNKGSYRGPLFGATSVHIYAWVGGAVIVNQSTASFIHCDFEKNSAEVGGAVYGDLASKINITDCRFSGNYATCSSDNENRTVYVCSGGAVFSGLIDVSESSSVSDYDNLQEVKQNKGVVTIIACNFTGNKAYDGGGVAVSHINVSVHNSKFVNNRAERSGGAMFTKEIRSANISDTDFSSNVVTNGSGGALYVFNSTLKVTNSNFISNAVNRDYGGAMCIKKAIICIDNCKFESNRAKILGGAIYTRNSHQLFINGCLFDTNMVMSPAGGGRAIRILRESNMRISNSKFIERGGMIHNGTRIHGSNINCQESSANFNYGVSEVGLHIASSTIVFYNTEFSGSHASVYAFKCNINFTGNTSFLEINNEGSKAPAALNTIESTVSIEGKCTLMYNSAVNGGAIYAIESMIYMNDLLIVAYNTAKDSGGGVYLYRSELSCMIGATLNLTGNTAAEKGGGLYAISSSVKVTYIRNSYTERSSLYFTGNKALKGGGVYLEANAKLYVFKERSTIEGFNHSSSIFFSDNSADSGGAVYVADETNAATCDSSLESHHSDVSECFVQVLTLLVTETVTLSTNLIGLEFSNNSAANGALLFGGLLDRCTVSPLAEVYKYYGKTYMNGIMYFMNITNINSTEPNLQTISSRSVRVCFCVENKPDCRYQPPKFKVLKAEIFTVTLVAVDHVNHTVANVTIYSSLESKSNRLDRGQHVQTTGEGCTALSFSLLSSYNFPSDKLFLSPDGPCMSANHSKRTIEIQVLPCHCPVGFERKSNREKCRCRCDSRLKTYTTNCNFNNKTIVRERNFWISYVTVNNKVHNCISVGYIGHLNCPFDYCVSANSKIQINLSVQNGTDVQCANHRTGILCGQCKHGYSLSVGSSRCIYCPKKWVAEMTGIVLAVLLTGVVLVTLLLVLNITVATGTINGLIFYVNVVSSTSVSIQFATPQLVIAWLNLEPGFDGCFINGLDAYWKTWLKFVFPMYVFLLVLVVMVISRWSPRFSRLIGKRNPVATLNTLILLSYTKLLHTVISILSYATLDCPDSNESVMVWVVDANIKYLSRKHMALFTVGVLILLAGVVYTALIFSWQWLLTYQDKWIFKWVRNQKLCHFLEPYHAPYTFKHRYWTGLLLFVRIALFVSLATNTSQDPYASLVAISVAISSILILKGTFFKIYKNQLPNNLENFCFLNIILLCIANFYIINKGYTKVQEILAYISGSVITLLFLLVIAYHVFTEIIMKHKSWKMLRTVIEWSKAVKDVNDITSPHKTGSSGLLPTTSVIDAPQQLWQDKSSNYDLKELLLQSVDNNIYT